MSGLVSDLRYALRVLRRSPGFTLIAVLSLAIGIGANTAVFGVVQTLLLTPLPVESPRELKLLAWNREGDFDISQFGSTEYTDPETGARLHSNFSYSIYRSLREAAPPGVELFAFAFLRGVSVAVGDQPAVFAGGALVDGAYFSSLRPRMALGRGIAPEDDAPGAPLVAVLSHALWMRAFGGDPAVVGRTIRVNGESAQVVGVTAAGFKGLSMGGFFPQTEITVPVSAQGRVYARMTEESPFASDRIFWLRLMVRIPDRSSEAETRQALAGAMRAAPSPLVGPDGYFPNLQLVDGAQGAQPIAASVARLLYLLLGVVGIVLLIACVNLAGLMLARGVARQQEVAVRRALGSGRGRLMRQLMLESLVLALAGAVTGLLVAHFGREGLRGLLSGSLGTGAFGDVDMQMSLDPMVLGLCTALAITATLACGLLPALRFSALDPMGWLKQRGANASRPRLIAARALIAAQIAVSVPLVVGAVLFLRTVQNLGAVELGFDAHGLLSFKVDPGFTKLPEDQYPRLYQELLSRIDEIPAVQSVTLVENAPLSGIVSNSSIDVDGKRVVVYANGIGPAFVETLGARLVAGRMPGLQDGPDDAPVAAVNEKAVKEIFGGDSPLGRTLLWNGEEMRIVGVINDMPYRNQRDAVPPTVYPSAFQRSAYGGYQVFLRTDAPLGQIESSLREAVLQVDPDVPVPTIRAETEIIEQASAKERVFTKLLVLFGGFALLLACIGLHGVTSYAVTRRTSEFGLRAAVGARPGQILWLVLREVAVLAAIGLVVGVPAALAAAPLVGSLLYGVAPTNPWAVIAAALSMFAVAVGAGLLPALRASRLEAVTALRTD